MPVALTFYFDTYEELIDRMKEVLGPLGLEIRKIDIVVEPSIGYGSRGNIYKELDRV
jgi:peptidase E